MLINYNKEKPESIEGWELSYHCKDVPEFMQGKNKLTPGPAKDWKKTPEPVQEAIMEIAVKHKPLKSKRTIALARQY